MKRLPLPRAVRNFLLCPPGHFYSPVPSLAEVRYHETALFSAPPSELPGITLNTDAQLALFDTLKEFYPSVPFPVRPTKEFRYHFENDTYSYADAIILFCMMRHLRPKRIVEIGSGYSSCAILDTNDLFFDSAIDYRCIDPYPSRFRSLLRPGDSSGIKIIARRLQDVDLDIFSSLGSNDILFVDSTHVAKVGSDVNDLFFRILPALRSGVVIHFHDIMYPFEYPREWIYDGKAWNEAYMLRSFLQYNAAFSIIFFTTYLEHFYEERFRKEMPLCLNNRGGNIWIRKQ